MDLSPREIVSFQRLILDHYRDHGRCLPWRETENPYEILVSEFMLQQTQVSRVLRAYPAFLGAFPTLPILAGASQNTVLRAWQGLGYNRRALNLYRTARIIMNDFEGIIPHCADTLKALPGIGPATACSIAAFAFNIPTVIVETNIRSVFIHHFFPGDSPVTDSEIVPLVAATLDGTDPRQWYYALMDFGVALKSTHGNPGRRSTSYTRQSRFEGSDRQLRSTAIKLLLAHGNMPESELMQRICPEQSRFRKIVDDLIQEGFIHRNEGTLTITA